MVTRTVPEVICGVSEDQRLRPEVHDEPETVAVIEKAAREQQSGTAAPPLLAGLVLGSPEFQRR